MTSLYASQSLNFLVELLRCPAQFLEVLIVASSGAYDSSEIPNEVLAEVAGKIAARARNYSSNTAHC